MQRGSVRGMGVWEQALRERGAGGGCDVLWDAALSHSRILLRGRQCSLFQEAALGLGCSDSFSNQLFLSYTRIILFKVLLMCVRKSVRTRMCEWEDS